MLERTIQSVLAQTYNNVEFIVVDGNSTDATLEIIRRHEEVIDYWISEEDTGIYDAMNKGVKLARGDWIIFLGADDQFYSPDVLKMAAPLLRDAFPGIRVVYGTTVSVSKTGIQLAKVGHAWSPSIRRRFRQSMCFSHQGVFHHTALFRENGLFDTSYKISGDYEFLLRELRRRDARYLPRLIVASVSATGVSSRPENAMRLLKECGRARRQNGLGRMAPLLWTAILRTFARQCLWRLFGDRQARAILDAVRVRIGKPAYWTKI